MSERSGFWSSSAALDWEHGLVAGTGSLGAVLSGTPARHVVHVCHEEFFLPVNSAIPAPRIGERIADVRAALLAGDADAAAEITSAAAAQDGFDGRLIWTDPFIPVGAISWTPDDPTEESTYRRVGDFTTGRVAAEWTTADGERSSIALIPDRAAGTLALELFSTRGAAGVLSLDFGPDERIEGDYPSTDYGVFLAPSEPVFEGRRLTVDVEVDAQALPPFVREHPPSPSQPTGARLEVDVSDDLDPHPVDGGVHVRLPAGVAVRLPIHVELSGGRVEPMPQADASHASLFAATSLDLHSGVDDAVSYDDVLLGARTGDADHVLAALELAFASGRHTIISSTGVLPPTLVGIWQGTRRPAWSGDWTQNGNVQHGGVASLVASGTPELFTSYLRAIFRHVEDYVENAERVFGAEGWLLPARFDSHGRSNHFATAYPHLYWMVGGAWVLRLAWDQFSATGDLGLLREYAWPLARNVMAFATSVASADEAGTLHLAPSYSPENTPANRTNPLAVDATMDVAAFRDAARLSIRIAELLGEDVDRTAWESFAERLPPYRVADDGTFAEWLDPRFDEQLAHRHVSQLYPFWYEQDPAAETPELRAAALETIRRKLDWRDERPWAGRDGHQEMAFGLVGLGLAAARLGDADSALRCVESLARDFWRPNAVSTHDGDSIFNVDASGGLPAVVIEMLIQSQPGSLTILAALPASWPSGSIRGVRARGGVVIEELTWDADGATLSLALVPGSDAARQGDVVSVSGLGTSLSVDLSRGPRTVRLDRAPQATTDH
ncbi:glycoside hydrolase N-terminal domain-containing protein [Microbacterium sp. W4I20]|uniref:glycosyl hydrolase family 95 catalytic domain-containing protein n=1 Tax=Microbacterium sp. W4I20 TaxID=3042262 RepID=UPI00277D4060|nr:glycoside hydrolase N-terminal domain-containing protein [Microbacterium sp. W4I20]MDQ0726651.1 alpha-L-fucosidase 2 [Microbacterium sp. W4I20]